MKIGIGCQKLYAGGGGVSLVAVGQVTRWGGRIALPPNARRASPGHPTGDEYLGSWR